ARGVPVPEQQQLSATDSAGADTTTTTVETTPTTTTDGSGGGGIGGAAAGAVADVLASVHAVTPQQGVLGGLCIGVGLLLLFCGLRLYRPTVFLAGAVLGSAAGYAALVRLRPSSGYANEDTVLLLGPLAVGVVVGGFFLCMRRLAVCGVGAAGGFVVAMFVLGLRTGGAISSGWGRTVFVVVLCAVGGVAALAVEKHVVLVATSVTGAYGVVFGIDCFAHAGFVEASKSFVESGPGAAELAEFTVSAKVVALVVGFAVLALIGAVVQYRTAWRRDGGNRGGSQRGFGEKD
ncbi:hypothetical protein HK405_011671, partial [Cladochytrium tenue]